MIKNICTSLFLIAFIQMTSAQTLPKGFKSIFDGQTTTGWHNYGKKTVGSGWKVEDGVLHFDPAAAKNGQGGDLVTDLEYTNFHLKLEWKVAANSNSGILFYVKEDAKKYDSKSEAQTAIKIFGIKNAKPIQLKSN